MSGDILKRKILNIYNDYKVEFIKYYKFFKRKIKKFIKKSNLLLARLKTNLLMPENRKKYLTITGILILINALLLGWYASFGYYHKNTEFSLINARVGNLYLEEYDYVLLVFIEDTDETGEGSGEYHLGDNIPTIGYAYSGYKCENNSILVYDDVTKMTSVTTTQKEVCSVYFDVIGSMDLTISIMLEDKVNSETFTISEDIPYYGYKYSHYKCENGSELTYNEELHSVKVSTSTKDYCNIYYKKEAADIEMNLYIEDGYQSRNYINRTTIPANVVYTLNNEKSNCTNINNETLAVTLTYEDGYIYADISEASICNVYLDVANE